MICNPFRFYMYLFRYVFSVDIPALSLKKTAIQAVSIFLGNSTRNKA